MAHLPNRFMSIPPGPSVPDVVHAIIEIPKGRRSKFEIDKEHGLIRLDRYLYSSMMYPGDYGIIPQTLAEDGDPLDIIVMVNEPTFSGCLIEARPIGLFKMTDSGTNDFKILAVPASDPLYSDYHDLWRVPPHFLREVEHFFGTYKQLEETTVVTEGWEKVSAAKKEIIACIKRYKTTDDIPPGFQNPKKTMTAANQVDGDSGGTDAKSSSRKKAGTSARTVKPASNSRATTGKSSSAKKSAKKSSNKSSK